MSNEVAYLLHYPTVERETQRRSGPVDNQLAHCHAETPMPAMVSASNPLRKLHETHAEEVGGAHG